MNVQKERSNVLIYGAGKEGIITKRTLEQDALVAYKIAGLLDEQKSYDGMKIEGVSVYHTSLNLKSLIENKKIKLFIFSTDEVSVNVKKKIINTCLEYKVRVLYVPPMQKWINGELSFKQIKKINKKR